MGAGACEHKRQEMLCLRRCNHGYVRPCTAPRGQGLALGQGKQDAGDRSVGLPWCAGLLLRVAARPWASALSSVKWSHILPELNLLIDFDIY